MADTTDNTGITNDELAAMFQREFLSLHEKIDGNQKITEEKIEAFRSEVNQRFEETNGEIAGISQQLSTETSERDRMQTEIDDHTTQLKELKTHAA